MDDNPRRLNIEVTTRCNLNCEMCIRRVWKEEAGDMDLETYRALLPAFSEVESVNFIGIGEPLLHQDLIEMIRLARSHLSPQGQCSLTTNAVLMDEAMARDLVSAGVDDLVVSVDGARPETFAAIRRDATLDQVLGSVDLLAKAKADVSRSLPRLGFEFVAMKRNVSELPALVDLAAQHGVAFIIVTNLLPHTEDMQQQILYDFNSEEAIEVFNETVAQAPHIDWAHILDNIDVETYSTALFGIPPLKDKLRSRNPVRTQTPGYNERMGEVFKTLDRMVARGRERNVLLYLKNLIQRDRDGIASTAQIFADAKARALESGIELELPPLIPWTRRECGFIRDRIAFVSWDGFVRPCHNLYHSYTCYINGREKSINSVSFGNVREHDFRDIWRTREYRSFRRQVDRFDFAPCGDCPHADGCYAVIGPVFRKDCYDYSLPCGDCPWGRGILKCM
jgi:putative metalloenzyme radical SAM/SPASM domain maturase